VEEMPVLSKRLLKPGGYVILILKFEAFAEWYVAYRKAGYTVMDYHYVFGYKNQSIQDRNPTFLPQRGADYGLIAYLTNGDHQFKPDFKSVFGELSSKSKRNLAIMSDIPAPRSRLCRPGTRSPFISSEKSVKLLMEAIDLFTPKSGLILDMYGGTLTTSIASLVKRRRCLVIEKKEDLFKAAVKRVISCIPAPNIAFQSPKSVEVICIDIQNSDTADDEEMTTPERCQHDTIELQEIDQHESDLNPSQQHEVHLKESERDTENLLDLEIQKSIVDSNQQQEEENLESTIHSDVNMESHHTDPQVNDKEGCTTDVADQVNTNKTSQIHESPEGAMRTINNPINSVKENESCYDNDNLHALATAAQQAQTEVTRLGMKRVRNMVKQAWGNILKP